MAQKTLVDGTEYQITKGRTLVGGTGYDIMQGRTLVGGTGYDILMEKIIALYEWQELTTNGPLVYLYIADAKGNPAEYINALDIETQFGDFALYIFDYEGTADWDYYASKEPVRIESMYADDPGAAEGLFVVRTGASTQASANRLKVTNRIAFAVPPEGFEIHEHINTDYPLTM